MAPKTDSPSSTRLRVWSISGEGLEHLKRYKYASGLYSWVDNNLGEPFWNATVSLVPLWVAPNLLTFLGLLFSLAAFAITLIYSSDLHSRVPAWALYLQALFLFIYQTLDAIDGKQARRTKASSPLGQLFDHGCDSLVAVGTSLIVASALQLGNDGVSIVPLMVFVVHTGPFFLINWEETCTGKMRHPALGVPEAQLFIQALLVVSGMFPDLWSWVLPVVVQAKVPSFVVAGMGATPGAFQLRHAVAIAALCVSLGTVISSILESARFVITEGSASDFFGATARLAPYATVVGLATAWYVGPKQELFSAEPGLTLFFLGMCFADVVAKMILGHVTDDTFWLFPSLLPLVVLTALAQGVVSTQDLRIPDSVSNVDILRVSVVFTSLTYLVWVVQAMRDITTFLGIKMFTIPPPKRD